MAETISFVPIDSEQRGEEEVAATAVEEETQEAPTTAVEEETQEAPATADDPLEATVPIVPIVPVTVPKRGRAKAAPREKRPQAPKAPRPSPRKPLRVERAPEQVIEPPFERPLSHEGQILQHMLSSRTRQRAEREELYKNFVGSF
jgi:hypothetical protein